LENSTPSLFQPVGTFFSYEKHRLGFFLRRCGYCQEFVFYELGSHEFCDPFFDPVGGDSSCCVGIRTRCGSPLIPNDTGAYSSRQFLSLVLVLNLFKPLSGDGRTR
jgi:hypothetical protein